MLKPNRCLSVLREGNLENQSFEYGTTYLAVAGLLNLLVAINAYDIAVGRKH